MADRSRSPIVRQEAGAPAHRPRTFEFEVAPAASDAQRQLANELASAVRSSSATHPIRIGVGDGPRLIDQLTEAFKEALKDATLAQVIGSDGVIRPAGSQATPAMLARMVCRGDTVRLPLSAFRGEPYGSVAQVAMLAGREVWHGQRAWRPAADFTWSEAPPVPSALQTRENLDTRPTGTLAPDPSVDGPVVYIGAAAPHRYQQPAVRPNPPVAVVPILPPRTTVSLPSLATLTLASRAHFDETGRHLDSLVSSGSRLTVEEQAWRSAYSQAIKLLVEPPAEPTQPSPPKGAATGRKSARVNQKLVSDAAYAVAKAKKSNRERRQERLKALDATAAAGTPLSESERRLRDKLETQEAYDRKNQFTINRKFDQAVGRRAYLVEMAYRLVEECAAIKTESPIVPTAKGAFLLYPRGQDPHDVKAMADWMQRGFNLRSTKIRSPIIDFQISWPHGSPTDREWMRHVVRRVVLAMGRDPDRDVLAASHEPGIHPVSSADGQPIHPHVHVTVRVCSDDGATWRCPNLHLLAQREMESINRARGWPLTTSAVGKGAQQRWYTPEHSRKIGWSINGVHTSTDDPAEVARVAREPRPDDRWQRPSAGLLITNAQFSERREALRKADERAFVAASIVVADVLQQLKVAGINLPRDDRGQIMLRYYGANPSQPRSATDQLMVQLSRAVMERDRAACSAIVHRIIYYSQ